ncbi:MAG: alanine--tRNA ligase [Oscillospiraceae bacterium]|nr:alanine--tRNA ligase [Oscillospiraceae bacterium]
MEWTSLNDLREKYLRFFESKDHLRLPSFSLVPQNDKSLLLINAGMAPMKKYFTGEMTPPKKRVTTCQKCIRTPDIERVGKTARHGTFFEMLGNFSFGDYFKEDATSWAWEFCTEVLKMPVDKLYVSVYEEDDEAWDIWTKRRGVKEDHMVRLGKEDNFWEHGAGPCGPCSEIYFDRGPEKGCGKPSCKVGCDCDRYVEFWNNVFTQFENDGKGNYTPLSNPNIDTGMGLERLACIMQGVDNLFEVDTIKNIMKHVSDIAGVQYNSSEKSDVSLRVITDHIRSTVMMISDGVLPSNEGRGYVLRRLLRRASRHGRLLGIEDTFLYKVAETVIKESGNAYPALIEKHDYIIKIITVEEENFARTIDQGLSLLENMISAGNGKTLSGEDAFKLSDTFGFPIDLTKEIIEERGMEVDEEKYNELVLVQKQTARNARKVNSAEGWRSNAMELGSIPETVFTGYDELSSDAVILTLLSEGGSVIETAAEGENAIVVLDKTPLYPGGGGQVADTGVIEGDGFSFSVTETVKTPKNNILHKGKVISGSLSAGAGCKASVNENRRKAIARNHTSAHLLQAALRNKLGSHVEQAGQLVNESVCRFDFTHFSPLTSEELAEVENEVNSVILSALPVVTVETTIEEAKKRGAMALFGEKYGDKVRMVDAGGFSIELCGGTHVKNTGEIGLFKIISEASVASGVRRVEVITGLNALGYVNSALNNLHKAAASLKCSVDSLSDRAAGIQAELRSKEKELEKLKAEIASEKAASLITKVAEKGGVTVYIANAGEADAGALRTLLDGVKNDESVIVAAGKNTEKGTCSFACVCGKNAVASGAHAGNIVRAVAQIAGGSGGGKPDSAMAGGKDITKIEAALESVADTVTSMLK